MSGLRLVVYATPTGLLAAACDTYWRDVAAVGATTAQTYPPHCTLTGFFQRPAARVDAVAADLAAAIAVTAAHRRPYVDVVALRVDREWVGLELRSRWLCELTERFAARHRVGEGEDELRPKSWLHLSLAYGIGFEPVRHGELARSVVDPTLPAGWEVGLWQRDGERWTRHLNEVVVGRSA